MWDIPLCTYGEVGIKKTLLTKLSEELIKFWYKLIKYIKHQIFGGFCKKCEFVCLFIEGNKLLSVYFVFLYKSIYGVYVILIHVRLCALVYVCVCVCVCVCGKSVCLSPLILCVNNPLGRHDAAISTNQLVPNLGPSIN